MKEEKKVVVYYPKNKKQSPASLSTQGRLISYNEQLKESLNNGIYFTEILNKLVKTNDSDELLSSFLKLSNYKLDTAYLLFLQQYSQSDFYLIFFNRLLQLHNHYGAILQTSKRNEELHHEFANINRDGYYIFEIDQSSKHGAFYVEKNTSEKIFYVDFEKKVMRINSSAVVNLMVVNYKNKYDYETIKYFEMFVLAIGYYLKEDYGFDVDFNLLDPSNRASYPIIEPKEPKKALDRLFIMASNFGYMLVADLDGNAELKLKDDTCLNIFYDDEKSEWVLQISDKNGEISLFDLLFRYEFIYDWYLENLDSLKIKSDMRYFSE